MQRNGRRNQKFTDLIKFSLFIKQSYRIIVWSAEKYIK